MGIHATAMLGFGVLLGNKVPKSFNADEDFFDFSEFLAKEAGLVEPSYSDQAAYQNYRTQVNQLERESPAEICCFGDHETTYYCLVVNGSVIRADEKDPTFISVDKFTIDPKKLEVFQSFCTKFGINSAPKWILMSRYD